MTSAASAALAHTYMGQLSTGVHRGSSPIPGTGRDCAPRQLTALHGTESSMATAAESPGRGYPDKLWNHHLGNLLQLTGLLDWVISRASPASASGQVSPCPWCAGPQSTPSRRGLWRSGPAPQLRASAAVTSWRRKS